MAQPVWIFIDDEEAQYWENENADPEVWYCWDTKSWRQEFQNKLRILNEDDQIYLTFNLILTPDCLNFLTPLLQYRLIKRVTLKVHAELISTSEFQNFIQNLPKKTLRYVELVFDSTETKIPEKGQKISHVLTHILAPHVDFPLMITSYEEGGFNIRKRGHYNRNTLQLNDFEQTVIQNIQRYHASANYTQVQRQISYHGEDETSKPQIRLKSLIKSQHTHLNEYAGLKIEIQHTEETQLKVAVEENEEITVTQQSQDEYNGTLIDSRAFKEVFQSYFFSPPMALYRPYTSSQKWLAWDSWSVELFANLPHAIKYLSPAASREYLHLLPQFSSLNSDNLPQGFLLKRTRAGELVLDFDLEYERQTNAFTPHNNLLYHEIDPDYYNLQDNPRLSFPSLAELKTWHSEVAPFVSKDEFTALISNLNYPTNFTNLWIRYGNTGLKNFLHALSHLDQIPRYNSFYFVEYFNAFKQLDYLMEGDRLKKCIIRIKTYDSTQLNFLNTLLSKSHDVPHDLETTLNAFETFWHEVDKLCVHRFKDRFNPPVFKLADHALRPFEKHIIQICESTKPGYLICRFYQDTITSITIPRPEGLTSPLRLEDINGDIQSLILKHISRQGIELYAWSDDLAVFTETSPVVYLERLLTILKNARHIDEQIRYLDEINLDVYRAFYASQHEGFKTVHYEMDFEYLPDGLNLYQFENLPSNLNYFKHSLILTQSNTQLHYIDSLGNAQPLQMNPEVWSQIRIAQRDFKRYNRRGHLRHALVSLLGITPSLVFNPHHRQFQVHFSELYSMAIQEQIVDPGIFYSYLHRFMGQQVTGISYGNFRAQIETVFTFRSDESRLPRYMRIAFASLFFITHPRYDASHPLKILLTSLLQIHDYDAQDSEHASDVFTLICESLMRLYQTGSYLNNIEGEVLCQIIAAMCANQNKDIEQTIKRFLTHLEKNKQATLGWLACRYQQRIPATHPIIFTLDRIETWSAYPLISATWPDTLFAFADRISVRGISAAEIEQVKEILCEATTVVSPSNLTSALQWIMHSHEIFSCSSFIKAMTAIKQLPHFNINAVKGILTQYQISMTAAPVANIVQGNDSALSALMANLLMILKQAQQNGITTPPNLSPAQIKDAQQLAETHDVNQLQAMIQAQLSDCGFILSSIASYLLSTLLNQLRDARLRTSFNLPENMIDVIKTLPAFANPRDFVAIARIGDEAAALSPFLKPLAEETSENQKKWAEVLACHIGSFDYGTFHHLMHFIHSLPQSDKLAIFTQMCELPIKQDNDSFNTLIDYVREFRERQFAIFEISQYIYHAGHNKPDLDIKFALIDRRQSDPDDPLLKLILRKEHRHLFHQGKQILDLTRQVANKLQVSQFLSELSAPSLTEVLKGSQAILVLLAKSNSTRLPTQAPLSTEQWQRLIQHLQQLNADEFQALASCYQFTTPNTLCLFNALNSRQPGSDFKNCLISFETAPYGKREETSHFDVSQVERVVNQSRDLSNDTPYPYERRKALMEAFLFVNALGQHLPVFHHKPAKDLRNEEIQTLFHQLKNGTFSRQLSPLHTSFFALALIREAMYRATGQFPYSTQIISILDLLWHRKQVISNIDTGQGKSLIDIMKAALLWLTSDRVDVSTSSITDAKRDLANYSSFLNFLAIPYATAPITSNSEFSAFQTHGINYSTFAQLSLFFAKARVYGHHVDKPTDCVSFIANESDYSLLDDRTVYRFASAEQNTLGAHGDWIYDQINEFVLNDQEFIRGNTSQDRDVTRLKQHLRLYAKTTGKSLQVIDRLGYDQLLIWIESALLVNYKLQENQDYIIPPDQETVIVHGKPYLSHVVKLLMQEADIKTKVSSDSKFGNGVQQLLYASLNRKYPDKHFVIEPETKTILSSNNKNLMDYYLHKQGYIWGSSGTVGSNSERLEQLQKYGVAFSKIEPHQQKQVKLHPVAYYPDQTTQFQALIEQLSVIKADPSAPSHLVFCKDIATAESLYRQLKAVMRSPENLQLYTGHGHEEATIQKAAEGGMITVTTAAIGRNTDILYNKSVGMHVWHTRVNSWRIQEQGSGRTGRQGSIGEVHFLINQAEMHGHSIQSIQQSIDNWSARERESGEPLYDVLAYLLHIIESIPEADFAKQKSDSEQSIEGAMKAQFIRTVWPAFSEACEKQYRQMHMNQTYSLSTFGAHTLNEFKSILQKNAPRTSLHLLTCDQMLTNISRRHAPPLPYVPYSKPVKIADCVPPLELAFSFLGHEHTCANEDILNQIKARVEKLLKDIAEGNALALLADYTRYLSTTNATQVQICEVHRSCLNAFLSPKTQSSSTARWYKYHTYLARTANDQGYLLLFSAFAAASNQAPVVEMDTIKATITQLLEAYLSGSSWYISSERKQRARSLIYSITSISTLEELIHLLNTQQVELAQADLACNKNRSFKKLHFFGESRLQNVLSQALDLSTALSPIRHNDALPQLNEQHQLALKSRPSEKETPLSQDQILLSLEQESTNDKQNAKVLKKMIEAGIRRQRWGLFKYQLQTTSVSQEPEERPKQS